MDDHASSIDAVQHRAQGCSKAFNQLWQSSTSKSYKYIDVLSDVTIGNAVGRYLQWIGNMGAGLPSTSTASLDSRLADATPIRNFIVKTLTTLHASLEQALDIVSNKRPARVSSINLQDVKLQDYDLSSDSDDSTGSGRALNAGYNSINQVHELVEIERAIKASISTLFRASIFIRRNTLSDRRLRARVKAPTFTNTLDIAHIREKFPGIDDISEGLSTRLGEANARRRQFFKYCRDHDERLSGSVEKEVPPPTTVQRKVNTGHTGEDGRHSIAGNEIASTRYADTEATKFQNKNSSNSNFESLMDESVRSTMSYATKIIPAGDDDIELFPNPPEECRNGEAFLCPYCYTFVQLDAGQAEQQWRHHIIKDLEPYICTYRLCDMKTYASSHAWFDHELAVHRTEYQCSLCTAFVGKSQNELTTHLRSRHTSQITVEQLNETVHGHHRLPSHIPANDCPFCGSSVKWATDEGSVEPPRQSNEFDFGFSKTDNAGTGAVLVVTVEQYREHVAQHLRTVALFALPRLVPPDSEANMISNAAGDLGSGHRSLLNSVGSVSFNSPVSSINSAEIEQQGPAAFDVPEPDASTLPRPVFGVSLDVLFKRDGSAVPLVLSQCIQAVDLFGLEVEGIYSRPGNEKTMLELKARFQRDYSTVSLSQPTDFSRDIHAVATLSKHFLQELTEPLMTDLAYEESMQAAKIADKTVCRDSLHAIINSLPDSNYATLRVLILHLNRVVMHSSVNMMTSSDLAVIFAPTLFVRKGAEQGDFTDIGWQARAVETILNNALLIFEDDD